MSNNKIIKTINSFDANKKNKTIFDIGADAQNIQVYRDKNGNIIGEISEYSESLDKSLDALQKDIKNKTEEVKNALEAHEEKTINSPEGVHGLSYDQNMLRYFNGTHWVEIQTGGGSADKISYDNSKSGLQADNVQDAIDALLGEVDPSVKKKSDIKITTREQSLYGRTVFIQRKVNENWENYKSGNFTSTGALFITIEDFGEFLFSVSDREGNTAKRSLTIENYGTYRVLLNFCELYGFRIDMNDPNMETRVSYLEDCDNFGYRPAFMDYTNDTFNYGDWENAFFIKNIKIITYATYQADSMIGDYYILDKDDFTKTINGEDYEPEKHSGNEYYIGFPQTWYKCWEDKEKGYQYCKISNKRVDDSFKADIFYNKDGQLLNYFFWGMFKNTYSISNRRANRPWSGYNQIARPIAYDYSYTSSGVATNTVVGISYYNGLYGNNANASIYRGYGYEDYLFGDYIFIINLLILIGKTCNLKKTFGKGRVEKMSGNWEIKTGSLFKKGLFYGSSGNNSSVKIFGIEDFWGWIPTSIAGIRLSTNMEIEIQTDSSKVGSGGYRNFNPQYIIGKVNIDEKTLEDGELAHYYIDKGSMEEIGLIPFFPMDAEEQHSSKFLEGAFIYGQINLDKERCGKERILPYYFLIGNSALGDTGTTDYDIIGELEVQGINPFIFYPYSIPEPGVGYPYYYFYYPKRGEHLESCCGTSFGSSLKPAGDLKRKFISIGWDWIGD